MKPDPLRGLFEAKIDGKTCVVEYESDSELGDFEQIPLLEEGGIEAFIKRKVLPYTPDARLVEADTKIGYEVSFTLHFYQPPKLRTLGGSATKHRHHRPKGKLGRLFRLFAMVLELVRNERNRGFEDGDVRTQRQRFRYWWGREIKQLPDRGFVFCLDSF